MAEHEKNMDEDRLTNQFYGQIFTIERISERRNQLFPNQEDLKILLEFLEDRKDILDLGCGTGFTCEWLAIHGKNVTGVEPNTDYVNTMRILIEDNIKDNIYDKIDIQIGSIENYQPKKYFDAIVFLWSSINEVINRKSQIEVLKRYMTYLKPDGLLYIDTVYIPEESKHSFYFKDPYSGTLFESVCLEGDIRIIHPKIKGWHIIRCDTPYGWKNIFNLAGYDRVIECIYKCANGFRRLVVVGEI